MVSQKTRTLVDMLFRNFYKHSNPPTLLIFILSGKLSREKIFANLWKIQFSRKLLQIVSFCCANRCHAPKISQKITFTISHKIAKFTKVFSLESFPLYSMLVLKMFGTLPPSSGALLMTLFWVPLPYQPYQPEEKFKALYSVQHFYW